MSSTLLQARRFLIPRSEFPWLATDTAQGFELAELQDGRFRFRASDSGLSLRVSNTNRHVVELAIPKDISVEDSERIEALSGQPFEVVVSKTQIECIPINIDQGMFASDGVDESEMAVPPGWIRQRYVGHNHRDSFLNSGAFVIDRYKRIASLIGKDLTEDQTVLDFGCGCGRIARHFLKNGFTNFLGADVDAVGIAWAEKHLAPARFLLSAEWPPLDIPDESVDFAYAVSVFTHLDEQHGDAWLRELSRILKPGSIVIATFRGTLWVQDRIPDAEAKSEVMRGIKESGLTFHPTKIWKGVFPDFYQGTYHSYDYIASHWCEHFDVVGMFGAAHLDNSQDAAVLIKRSD